MMPQEKSRWEGVHPTQIIYDEINEWIQKSADAQAAAIEKLCEQAITDPLERGILVITDFVGMYKQAALSRNVPYGTIYIVKEGTIYDTDTPVSFGFVSPPTEGGEGA
jgi:hypothetical protein